MHFSLLDGREPFSQLCSLFPLRAVWAVESQLSSVRKASGIAFLGTCYIWGLHEFSCTSTSLPPPPPLQAVSDKRKAALTATKTAPCFLGEFPAKIRMIACRIYTAAVRSLPVPVTSSWENQWRNLQRREVHCGSQLAPRPVGPFQLVGSGTWLMGPAVAKAHGTVEPFTSCPRRKTKVGRDNSALSGYTSEDLWMSSQSPQHKNPITITFKTKPLKHGPLGDSQHSDLSLNFPDFTLTASPLPLPLDISC